MTIRTTTALAAAVAALTLSAAQPALASTITRHDAGSFTGLSSVEGGLAEVNTATLEVPQPGLYNFRDTTAVLKTDVAGCTVIDAGHLAQCAVDPTRQTVMSLVLGAGNDTGVAKPLPNGVQNGGPGGFTATLAGGDGADTLESQGPVTTFFAGPGEDRIVSGPVGDDVNGEAGVDSLDYSTHAAGVIVDLLKVGAVQGSPGEGDTVKNVENLFGTAQGDTLFGNAQDNYLYGDKGADKLSGRDGDDVIEARDFSTDQIGCGAGKDEVFANQSDVVGADCETVTRSGIPQGGNGLGTPGQQPPPPVPPGPNPAPGDPGTPVNPGDPQGPAVTKDTAAPALSKVAFLRKKVRRGKRTSLLFRLTEPAALSIRVERVLPGLRKGTKCVAATAKLRRAKARKCTRTAKVTTLTRGGGLTGLNSTSFDAKAGKKALKPGTYRAVLVASDAAGNRSTAKTAGLRVVS